MTSNDGCWRRRLAVLAIATSLLSGCATVSSDGGRLGACPPVVEYSREFQARAAEELALLPEGSAVVEMLADYAVMRRAGAGVWNFVMRVVPTGAGNAPVPAHAKFTEIRLRPRLGHQPFQQRTQPLQPTPLQAEPRRRSRRVARSLRGIRDSVTVLAETSSNWCDTTSSANRQIGDIVRVIAGIRIMAKAAVIA